MAASAGMALAGTSSMGLGALLLYAAYRNVPVFGPSGLLTGALRTGKLQPVTAAQAQAQAQAQQNYVPWWDRTGPISPGGSQGPNKNPGNAGPNPHGTVQ